FAGVPTDPVGSEVKLPFRDGQTITLVRKSSSLQSDGSISWVGEVQETGERAILMVWGNALLTGYFAYKGTLFAVESLGGGVHAFAELGRVDQLQDHPNPPPPPPRNCWARAAAPRSGASPRAP